MTLILPAARQASWSLCRLLPRLSASALSSLASWRHPPHPLCPSSSGPHLARGGREQLYAMRGQNVRAEQSSAAGDENINNGAQRCPHRLRPHHPPPASCACAALSLPPFLPPLPPRRHPLAVPGVAPVDNPGGNASFFLHPPAALERQGPGAYFVVVGEEPVFKPRVILRRRRLRLKLQHAAAVARAWASGSGSGPDPSLSRRHGLSGGLRTYWSASRRVPRSPQSAQSSTRHRESAARGRRIPLGPAEGRRQLHRPSAPPSVHRKNALPEGSKR